MKIAWINKALILIGYCIPFAYLAVNGDASYGTLIFYGFMVVCFAFLCGWSIKTDNLLVPYIGNVLSFASSYLIAKWLDVDPMPEYFKPFTFYSLIALISAVVLIMHTVIVLVCQMKKRPVDQ